MAFKFGRTSYIATVLITFLFVFGAFANVFAASDYPPKPSNDIYVVDQAGILKQETKNQMMALGRELNSKTKAQIVVVTVKSTNGISIEEYANTLFRNWGIGDKEKNNGILFLVAQNDKKMRIEVGYGLEGRIPDMTAGRIMDDNAKPYFSKGDFNTGILNTYKVLISETGAEYGLDNIAGTEVIKKGSAKDSGPSLLALFLAMVLWQQILVIIIILFILYVCLNLGIFPFLGGGGGGGGGSSFFDNFGDGSGGGGGSNSDW